MSPLCISANCFFKSQTRLQCILHFLFCFFSMPRDRKRITDRGVPLPILSLAAAVVSNDGRTVRSVAKEYLICHTTLYRFIKKRERLCPGEEMRTEKCCCRAWRQTGGGSNLRRERNTGNSCMCRQCIREHDSTQVHIPAG